MFAATLLLCGCSQDRAHILKVYNWADYIDEDLIGEFEEWYEEQTGEKVEISRYSILGILKPQETPKWAMENARIFIAQERQKGAAR